MTDPRALLSEIARLKAELDDTRVAVAIAYKVGLATANDEIARLRNILKETENAFVIAYEDGAMQRLGRWLSEAQKEIARLNAELADAKRQADDAQGAVQVYCDDYNRAKAETGRLRSELGRLTQERDAALSAVEIMWRERNEAYLAASLINHPQDGEVYVVVSGLTGSGKSAIAGEIEIALRAIGVSVEWPDGKSEKNMTHADWQCALELYNPRVVIVERNIPVEAK